MDNYAPEITAITVPLMYRYAKKIGADIHMITRRKFPLAPTVYEKLQIHELGRDYDWNIFFDGDALLHTDFFDVTEHLSPDTVMFNSFDLAGNRFRYDDYFRRDGRHVGACNWFAVAHRQCLDLWRPLDDLTIEEAVLNIYPVNSELRAGIKPEHLIDDYVLSRNIARFGLKFLSLRQLLAKLGRPQDEYLWHAYGDSTEQKLEKMRQTMCRWNFAPVGKHVSA